MNITHLRKEFSSIRLITALTPNTFLRKIIVISTVICLTEKDGNNLGETAVAQTHAINSLEIDFNKLDLKPVKTHNSVNEALQFHSELINKYRFIDCENLDKK